MMTMTTLLRLPLGTHRWTQLPWRSVLDLSMFLRVPTAAAPFCLSFGCVCTEISYATAVCVCAVNQ